MEVCTLHLYVNTIQRKSFFVHLSLSERRVSYHTAPLEPLVPFSKVQQCQYGRAPIQILNFLFDSSKLHPLGYQCVCSDVLARTLDVEFLQCYRKNSMMDVCLIRILIG